MTATAATNKRQAVLDALALCIEQAPEATRYQLNEALETYALAFARSYRDLTKQPTLVCELLLTLEEAAECRIHRDRTGMPIRDPE